MKGKYIAIKFFNLTAHFQLNNNRFYRINKRTL